MFVCIVLLVSYAILVPSTAGSPVIPAQIYNVYQQNGYANPSGNPPNDITSYLQGIMAQNQSPPTNISPSSIKQILLNKILSNPAMQTILNPNAMGYSSDLREYPSNKISPNNIRNFVAPVESFDNNNNKNNGNLEDKINDAQTEKKSKQIKRRKSSKNKRKHDNAENNQSSSSKKFKSNDINPQNAENIRASNKKSKKRSHKHSTEVSTPTDETKYKENASSTKTKTKRRKHKEGHQEKTNPVEEETKVENEKPRRRHKKQKKNKDLGLSKVASENNATTETPKEMKEGINVAHSNEGVTEENRIARNSKQETNNLLQSLPNKPETIANNYLKGMPHFENNPMLNSFFANYDNIYQSMMKNKMENTDKRETVKRKPTRNKNNQRLRIENKKNNSTKESTVVKGKQEVRPKIHIVTTEKPINVSEKVQPNVGLHPKAEVRESLIEKPETEETTTKVSNNEDFNNSHNKNLPQESNTNTEHVYEGYIDDYYPLFTDSAAYANNREFYIRDIGDNKYFYATDKANTDFNRRKSEIRKIPDRFIKDDKRNELAQASEKEEKQVFKDSSEKEEEELQFRTPPQLELPDFQTRQVGKSEIKPEPYYRPDKNENSVHRFVGDKSFTETKTPYYTGHQNGIKPQTKEKPQNVETVFARSKVVKYGAVHSSEEDNISLGGNNNSSSHIDNWKDDSYVKDRGTTYVVATSFDDSF